MTVRRMDLRDWLAEVLEEGQDSLGAYEMTLGGAVFVGYIALWWLRAHAGLGLALLYVLCAAALWMGARLEQMQFHELGRRRFRGTLYRRFTWLVALGAFVLAWLPIGLAHARAWNLLSGWHDGPIVLMLTLGLCHLALGLKTNTLRWTCLGGALCALAAIIPAVAPLRDKLYFVTGLLAGGSLLAAGLMGRLRYLREARAAGTPQSVSN
jgi:hypothetical protein